MIPILYDAFATDFSTNGIGPLFDVRECIVTEERNGAYELEMRYPLGGAFYESIDVESIIKAVPYVGSNPQLFRIHNIERDIFGNATIQAYHISYQLSGIPVKPLTASSLEKALEKINSQSLVPSGFTFVTDKTSTASFKVEAPKSIRACLGGSEGSILDVYGGEYLFDNFTVHLLNERGRNNGVKIIYGSNMTELDHTSKNNFNGVYPYYANESDGSIYPASAVLADGEYPYPNYEIVDFSSDYETKPSESDLLKKAKTNVKDMGKPSNSVDVSFSLMRGMPGYDKIDGLDNIQLCDTVRVIHKKLGLDYTAKVTKTVYNVLRDCYDEISVGEVTSTLSDTIVGMSESASNLNGLVGSVGITLYTDFVIPTNDAAYCESTVNLYKEGYYLAEVIRVNLSNKDCFPMNISLSRDDANKTVTCKVRIRNIRTSGSATTNVKAYCLYIKNDFVMK